MEKILVKIAPAAGLISLVLGLVCVWAVTGYAPVEKVQGPVQKLMYLHVAAAIVSYAGVGLAAFGGGMYLWKQQPQWDRMGKAGAELGLILSAVVLITGPLWAKPIWGIWWVWDARLTFTLLLFLILVAYFMVRSLVPGDQGARFAAVVGILALVDVPFVKIAAEKFRTLHPVGVVKGGMTQEMGLTLTLSVITMFVFFVYLVGKRLEVSLLEERLSSLLEAADADGTPAPLGERYGTESPHRG